MTIASRDVVHPDLSTTGRVALITREPRIVLGDRTVISGGDLTVHVGERWAILGPNGCGKSTLLRAVLGEVPVARGVVGVNRFLVRAGGIGSVSQRLDLDPDLPTTVREFVTLGLIDCGLDRRARQHRLQTVFDLLDLAGVADRDLRRCSGGQRQRAVVARALVREPDLLLLDEPTAAMDAEGTRILGDALAQAGQRPLTILLVTHDPDLAARSCTHVVRITDEGRLVPERIPSATDDRP